MAAHEIVAWIIAALSSISAMFAHKAKPQSGHTTVINAPAGSTIENLGSATQVTPPSPVATEPMPAPLPAVPSEVVPSGPAASVSPPPAVDPAPAPAPAAIPVAEVPAAPAPQQAAPPAPAPAPASTLPSAAQIIAWETGELGYQEGYAGGHWDNVEKYAGMVPGMQWVSDQHCPWCAMFQSAAFYVNGGGSMMPMTASVAAVRDYAKAHGRFSEYPAVGALVLYGINGDEHIGCVTSFDGSHENDISGNTNNDGGAEGYAVLRHTHVRTDAHVYGYFVPEYPEGIVSADPAWGGQAGGGAPSPAAAPAPIAYTDASLYPSAANPTHGVHGDHITWLGQQLVRHGFGSHYQVGPGPDWGPADEANVRAFQVAQGWTGADADGYPGNETLRRLAA